MLLLTEAYPPAPMVGSHRAAKVARAFCSAGHDVHVLTTHGGSRTDACESGGIVVEQLRQGRSPRELANAALARLRRRMVGGNGSLGDAGPGLNKPEAAEGIFRQTLVSMLWLPDDQQSFIPAAYREGRQLGAVSRIDLIYSTAPAFSVHVAGMLLKRKLRCPWVAEFRDPWTDNAAERLAGKTVLTRTADRALERAVLNRADVIVTNAQRAADLYRQKLGPYRAHQVLCAINGIPYVRDTRAPAAGDVLRIVYAGNLYPPRDPFPLLKAFATLHKGGSAPRFEILFVGHCQKYGDQDVATLVDAMGLGDVVKFVSYVEADRAQALVETADLLLLPAQGWHRQIPNKLFDYLASRVPILAMVEQHSEAEEMLTQAGGHFVIPADAEDAVLPGVGRALQAAVRRPLAGSEHVLRDWLVEPQMTALVQQIDSLVQPRPGTRSTSALRATNANP
jgi:glycosyltransferase involved in cell wall biosynthesis